MNYDEEVQSLKDEVKELTLQIKGLIRQLNLRNDATSRDIDALKQRIENLEKN